MGGPAEVVEAEEAGAAVEVEEVEDREEPGTVVVEVMGKIKVSQARVRIKIKEIMVIPDTRRPGTPTCRRSSPVSAIGPMGNLLIFVWNQGPVPGSSIGCQNLIINEILTSSTTRKTTKILEIHSIRLHFQK